MALVKQNGPAAGNADRQAGAARQTIYQRATGENRALIFLESEGSDPAD
jgi:hypothetical protein